jgi:hypothetical protein
MNNNNIIIELRQRDSNNIIANGDYESTLGDDIIIENGDVVTLKSCWIDTKKEGTINITEDLTLTTKHCLYFTDWNVDVTNKNSYIDVNGNNVFNGPNSNFRYNFGRIYKSQRFIPYSFELGNNFIGTKVNSILYEVSALFPSSVAMPVVYQYNDAVTGQLHTITKTIPVIPSDGSYTDTLNIYCAINSFQIVSPDVGTMFGTYNISFGGIQQEPVKDNSYAPFIFTKTFSLPAGSYAPSDLSLYLSEQLSSNETVLATALYNSPFIKTSKDFKQNIHAINGDPNLSNSGFLFSDDLTTRMAFNYDTGNTDYLIGSSQVALEYDDTSGKFNFTYMHLPMYDDTGTNICVRYSNIGGINYDGTNYTMMDSFNATTTSGGIFFTDLQANITSSGKSYDFWEGVLGFDLSTLCAKLNPTPLSFFSGNPPFGLEGYIYSYNLTVGENITEGYYGLDSIVIKKPNSWYIKTNIAAPNNTTGVRAVDLCSTIDNTKPIIAAKPYVELLENFSHYVLDCNLHFLNDYIGSNKWHNIQGTVSKYYSFGNYTYGDESGAIQYVHSGLPIILKSVKVRILKSDKTRDVDLGFDNTLIFEIVKAQQQQQPKK